MVLVVKDSPASAGDIRNAHSILGWEDPLEKEMAPTPISLPGKSHGQRSLMGCSARGRKESDATGHNCIPCLALPSLCKSTFLTSIIFLLPEELLLTFLSGLIYWEQIPSSFICLRVLLLHC